MQDWSGVAPLQEDPGRSRGRGGSALVIRCVKWEGGGHCLPFKKSQRLREALRLPQITQQQRPSWPPGSRPRAAGHWLPEDRVSLPVPPTPSS